MNAGDEEGKTALHYSAGEGKADVVGILLGQKGVNANAADAEGKTALHYAAKLGQVETVSLLLQHKGIDVGVRDRDGQTALDIASGDDVRAVLMKRSKK